MVIVCCGVDSNVCSAWCSVIELVVVGVVKYAEVPVIVVVVG